LNIKKKFKLLQSVFNAKNISCTYTQAFLVYFYTVSQKTGPLLRFEITPTNCA